MVSASAEEIKEHYYKTLHLCKITDIINEDILKFMLKGFFMSLGQSCILLYDTVQYDTQGQTLIGRIKPFDYKRGGEKSYFNQICWKYCQKDKNREKCDNWGTEIFKKYKTGVFNKAEFHSCRLGFLKFAYPIRINDEVRVLFIAGQKIKEQENSKNILDRDDIKELKNIVTEDDLKNEIERQAKKESSFGNINIQKSFEDFGNNLSLLINKKFMKLYRYKAKRKFLHQCSDYLVGTGYNDMAKWRLTCTDIIKVFCDIAKLEKAKIYSRRKKFFELQNSEEEHRIQARHILSHQFENDKIIRLSEYNDKKLISILKANEQDPLYTCQSGNVYNNMTTLILITGEINDKNENFIKDFFKVIARIITITSLYFSLEETQSKFRKNVGNVAHDNFNTLQSAIWDLDYIASFLKKDKIKEIKEVKKRITYLKKSTKTLRDSLTPKFKNINLIDLVQKVSKFLEKQASEKSCKIVINNKIRKAIIRGDETKLYRAFLNLIDNAIKYSFRGYYNPKRKEHRAIEIQIEICKNQNYYRVSISNYGVGIPEDKIDSVLEGERLKIEDYRKMFGRKIVKREGTGRGLQIVSEIIEEEQNGILDLKSVFDETGGIFSDKKREENRKKYLRYITTAKVSLPIYEESRR